LFASLQYRAVFQTDRIAGFSQASDSEALVKQFTITADVRATEVAAVYPSATILPENLPKLYLHLSAPMSCGEAYQRIHLLDADGQPINGAFLEPSEQWDTAGKQLMVLIHPGRIKRRMREVSRPVLEAGKRYTLVIDAAWRDAAGRPLADEFRKSFSVGPPDDEPPDVRKWDIDLPAGGTIEPLVVRFPEPLDKALEWSLWVVGADRRRLEGKVSIDAEETRWQFQPNEIWRPGLYQPLALSYLTDLAGNSLRPIEVVQHAKYNEVLPNIKLPFEVK
jgi:hypothetical protein